MKHFLKRVNRGIVLGAVLLIGLAVFIWQDELAFQKETPAIERTVTEYLETCAKANVFDASLQKIGAAMTQKQQSDKLQEFNKILDQYWSTGNEDQYWRYNPLTERLKNTVSENAKGKGYIQKFTSKLDGTPEITKAGPGNAKVKVNYTLVFEYAGNPSFFPGDFPESVDRASGRGPSSGTTADPKKKRITSSRSFNAELEKIGNSWKFTNISGGSGSGGQPVEID